MSQINLRQGCATEQTAYVKEPRCDRPLGYFRMAILAPQDDSITFTSKANLLSQIQTGCLAQKYFPIIMSDVPTVGTAETAFTQSAFMDYVKGAEGVPDFTATLKNHDAEFVKQTRMLNGNRLGMYLIDLNSVTASNGICGYNGGEGIIKAFPMQVTDFSPLKLQTGVTPHFQQLRAIFRDAGALTELMRLVDYPSTTYGILEGQIQGNKEVQLFTDLGTSGTGIAYVCPIGMVDSEILAEDWETQLETAGTWTILDSGGSAVTPTLDVVEHEFTIDGQTVTVKCVEMTFTANGTYTIQMKPASTLGITPIFLGTIETGSYQNDVAVSVTIAGIV